jgi:hypothetical protein
MRRIVLSVFAVAAVAGLLITLWHTSAGPLVSPSSNASPRPQPGVGSAVASRDSTQPSRIAIHDTSQPKSERERCAKHDSFEQDLGSKFSTTQKEMLNRIAQYSDYTRSESGAWQPTRPAFLGNGGERFPHRLWPV